MSNCVDQVSVMTSVVYGEKIGAAEEGAMINMPTLEENGADGIVTGIETGEEIIHNSDE